MPTNPDLAALSEAATQGDKADRFFAESTLQEELMRLWFAGRLVLIDEGMRERVARGLYAFMRKRRPAAPHWNDLMGDTQAYYRDLADAAIAAMGGK